ncbi:urocortin [Muntiacus reevesi]|uniref:urocortin n=1 Tax=Muntiacus reevesi TaxID=9886 RepID=UPI0033076F73
MCSGRGAASPEAARGAPHTLRCACVSRAGGTMRPAGRAALVAALLLLAQLRPGSSQWSPEEEAAAAGVRYPSLRWSPGTRNHGGGARALLLLLAEHFPRRRVEQGRWESGTAGERPRRDDPPLSIDLTFHLLRTLLELARTQSQRERAEQNRIIFDSVGK